MKSTAKKNDQRGEKALKSDIDSKAYIYEVRTIRVIFLFSLCCFMQLHIKRFFEYSPRAPEGHFLSSMRAHAFKNFTQSASRNLRRISKLISRKQSIYHL